MNRIRVFLTGATGNMGRAGLRELLRFPDRYEIVLLARPSKKNRKELAQYAGHPSVTVVWGDLQSYEDVLQGVNGADYVLHVGGMVSPAADWHPEKSLEVNVRAAENIIRAILAQPDPDRVGAVYIGSVAQTGYYEAPRHWGRCGDPLRPSRHDAYALSKCIAERIFAESGLKKWVSIRQTGMLYPALLRKVNDPIAFHVPLNGVLEWSTLEDSGRVLERCCHDELPESFWRSFYNLSSGPSFRLTNYEFEKALLESLGCPSVRKVFRAKWFATRNFHGQWYTDADRLEEFLHFRSGTTWPEYLQQMKRRLPWFYALAPLAPAIVLKVVMKRVALTPRLGTLDWFRRNNEERIRSFFGSREAWDALPEWEGWDLSRPSEEPVPQPLGFDETKPKEDWTLADLQQAAAFRGGECRAPACPSDACTPIEWRCSEGHTFSASPNLILRGGHWCPECLQASVGKIGLD